MNILFFSFLFSLTIVSLINLALLVDSLILLRDLRRINNLISRFRILNLCSYFLPASYLYGNACPANPSNPKSKTELLSFLLPLIFPTCHLHVMGWEELSYSFSVLTTYSDGNLKIICTFFFTLPVANQCPCLTDRNSKQKETTGLLSISENTWNNI